LKLDLKEKREECALKGTAIVWVSVLPCTALREPDFGNWCLSCTRKVFVCRKQLSKEKESGLAFGLLLYDGMAQSEMRSLYD
jgi:hypothetical protein